MHCQLFGSLSLERRLMDFDVDRNLKNGNVYLKNLNTYRTFPLLSIELRFGFFWLDLLFIRGVWLGVEAFWPKNCSSLTCRIFGLLETAWDLDILKSKNYVILNSEIWSEKRAQMIKNNLNFKSKKRNLLFRAKQAQFIWHCLSKLICSTFWNF
jgi:hypothetical protein